MALPLVFIDFVARILLFLYFLGEEFFDTFSLGLGFGRFQKFAKVFDVFSPDEAVHALSPPSAPLKP